MKYINNVEPNYIIDGRYLGEYGKSLARAFNTAFTIGPELAHVPYDDDLANACYEVGLLAQSELVAGERDYVGLRFFIDAEGTPQREWTERTTPST